MPELLPVTLEYQRTAHEGGMMSVGKIWRLTTDEDEVQTTPYTLVAEGIPVDVELLPPPVTGFTLNSDEQSNEANVRWLTLSWDAPLNTGDLVTVGGINIYNVLSSSRDDTNPYEVVARGQYLGLLDDHPEYVGVT